MNIKRIVYREIARRGWTVADLGRRMKGQVPKSTIQWWLHRTADRHIGDHHLGKVLRRLGFKLRR